MPKTTDGTHQGNKAGVPDTRRFSDPNSKRTKNRQRLGLPGNRGNVKAGKRRGGGR